MDNKPQNYTPIIALVVILALVAVALIYRNDEPITKNRTPEQQAAEAQSPLDNIAPISSNDHLQGNPSAPIAVVEFSDLECPFCKVFHQTLEKVLPEYLKAGQVVFTFRHFPLDSLHQKSRKEAEATECAAELGGTEMFWQYLSGVFAVTPSNDGLDPKELPKIAAKLGLDQKKFETCLASGKYAERVATQLADAIATGGQGTPHTILILQTKKKLNLKQFDAYIEISPDNSKVALRGALPENIVRELLTAIIKQSGS